MNVNVSQDMNNVLQDMSYVLWETINVIGDRNLLYKLTKIMLQIIVNCNTAFNRFKDGNDTCTLTLI